LNGEYKYFNNILNKINLEIGGIRGKNPEKYKLKIKSLPMKAKCDKN